MKMSAVSTFLHNQRGNVAITVGLSAIALIAAGGFAIDLSRGHLLRSRMQSNVDTAALSAGAAYNKNPNLTSAQVTQKAQNYFNAVYPPHYLGSTTPNVTVSMQGINIDVCAEAHLGTTLMQVVGQTDMDIKTCSNVLHDVAIPAEVVIAADITGSMSQILPGSTGTKYAGLTNAATNFINLLASSNSNNNIYTGIVPYTQTVNIGVPGVASVTTSSNVAYGGASYNAPTWNTDGSWMDPGDPSLQYDWASNAKSANGVIYLNRFGSQNPQGWGGCVMARKSNTSLTPNGLTLDISDDPPSVAPFQRFYYPSDQFFAFGDHGCAMCLNYNSNGSGTGDIGEPGGSQNWNGTCTSDFIGNNPWLCTSNSAAVNPTYWINHISNNPINQGTPSLYFIPNTSGPNYTCPITYNNIPLSIFPLQLAQNPGLLGTISNFTYGFAANYSDGTLEDIGLAWAYRLVSSKWAGFWKDGVDDPAINWRANPPANLRKFVILMTDGTNNVTNTNSYSGTMAHNSFTAYGLKAADHQNFGVNNTPAYDGTGNPLPIDTAQLDAKTLQLCTQMKKENITIYTIGFGTNSGNASTDVNVDLLTKCASDPTKFILASDNDKLNSAFQDIASQIVQNLRITQ